MRALERLKVLDITYITFDPHTREEVFTLQSPPFCNLENRYEGTPTRQKIVDFFLFFEKYNLLNKWINFMVYNNTRFYFHERVI